MDRPPRWWERDTHAARRGRLILRNRIKSGLRAWFEARGFTEVEAGALQVSPGNETHLHGLRTQVIGLDGRPQTRYLHTSPEFAAKKLLAAGETAIFDFARVYRNREGGALNVPEFTMLEWYRAGAPYAAVMEDAAALVRTAADIAGVREARFRGRRADPCAPPERLSVQDAFLRHAGIDLLSTVSANGDSDVAALRAGLEQAGIAHGPEESWSDLFSRVISERIEPRLGLGAPTLLTDYPVVEAALARPNLADGRVAERFELYLCGVELANGFGELTDAQEQRRRFEADMDAKERLYGERYPIDEDFLAALAAMPAASGVALGFDRLAMLMTGADSVNDVLWTPYDGDGA